MKIKIEVDENFIEEEIVIRCSALSPQVQAVQKAVSEVIAGSQRFVFYKGETEYYLPLEEILFFETDGGGVSAHMADSVYQTRYKLYKLQELLPEGSVWDLIWTVFAAAALVASVVKINLWGIFFSLAFLGIIYAEPLGITAITPWPILGAALLLSIGCSMIFPKKNRKPVVEVTYNGENGKTIHIDPKKGKEWEESYTRNGGDCLEFTQVFKSGTKYINTGNLRSVDVDCVFSSLKIYLDNAMMQGSFAQISIDNMFSGTTIYVPRTWAVIEKTDNVFGSITIEYV